MEILRQIPNYVLEKRYDHHQPLEELYGHQQAGIWLQIERERDKGLVRLKQLLDWYAEGFQVVTDTLTQGQYLLWLIVKYFNADRNFVYTLPPDFASVKKIKIPYFVPEGCFPFAKGYEWENEVAKVPCALHVQWKDNAARTDLGDFIVDDDAPIEKSLCQSRKCSRKNDTAKSNLVDDDDDDDDADTSEARGKIETTLYAPNDVASLNNSADHRKDLSDNHEEPESSDVENGENSENEFFTFYHPLTPASSSIQCVARKDEIPIAPLCEMGEEITAVKMVQFTDQLTRALRNGQTISSSLEDLIPKDAYMVLNLELLSAGLPSLQVMSTYTELITNLQTLYQEDQILSTDDDSMSEFIRDLIDYFQNIFEYPIDGKAIQTYSRAVMKKLDEYEINGVTSIDEVTARDSKPFLDAMAIFYESRASKNAFFELLHLYMSGAKAGVLELNHRPLHKLIDFINKLAEFFGQVSKVEKCMTRLNHPRGMAQPWVGSKRQYHDGGRSASPAKSVPLHDHSDHSGKKDSCVLCGRKGHRKEVCAFKPGGEHSTHPLVTALNGQPFSGSDVQRRLKNAVKWDDGKLIPAPMIYIPFRQSLLKLSSGQEILTEIHAGPLQPEPKSKANGSSQDWSAPPNKVGRFRFHLDVSIVA